MIVSKILCEYIPNIYFHGKFAIFVYSYSYLNIKHIESMKN